MNSTQSWQLRHQETAIDVVLVPLLLQLNRFHKLFWCFYCWLWLSKCQMGSNELEVPTANILRFWLAATFCQMGIFQAESVYTKPHKKACQRK